MRARDLFVETGAALSSNRGRSILTILGIVIGISAVISMTSLIGGVRESLIGELGLEQSRSVYAAIYYNGVEMTDDDIQQMQQDLPGYETVTGVVLGQSSVNSGDKQSVGSVYGVEPAYEKIGNVKLVSGRFITQDELDSAELVAVPDQSLVREVYGDENADVVGKTLVIGSDTYTIVGVAEANSVMTGTGTVYIPSKTCMLRINGSRGYDQIIGWAREGADIEGLSEDTKSWLASHYSVPDEKVDDAVYVQSMQSVVNEITTMMTAFQMLMGAIAGISLLVGGIGIMNMMLTNVTERIREIGLRKALGARRRDITVQFLLESICLCVVGGIFGILFGYLGAYLLAFAVTAAAGPEMGTFTVHPAISMSAVLGATLICIAIGVIFGYYPARRAAKLDPVESLHYQ